MIRPNYFAGLGKPKCELYHEIQKMIKQSGGRLRLAFEIENEWLSPYKRRKLRRRPERYTRWSTIQIKFVLDNYVKLTHKDLAVSLCKTVHAVRHKVFQLQREGYLPIKQNKHRMETTKKITDGSFMPIGKKYLGVKLINVPAQYLLWLYDNGLKHQGLKEYIEDNMDALKQGK